MTDPSPIDFGSGVIGYRTTVAGIDIPWAGLDIEHPDARDPTKRHEGGLLFDLPEIATAMPDSDRWQVVSWEPLSLTPSVHCDPAEGGCGLHGWITDGRWMA